MNNRIVDIILGILSPINNILIKKIAKSYPGLARLINVLYWTLLQLLFMYISQIDQSYIIYTTPILLSIDKILRDINKNEK